MIAGWAFIVTGAPAKQIRLCVQLVSSAPVEHQHRCLVLQEHLALKRATRINTTAPSVPLDTTVKVGNMDLPAGISSNPERNPLPYFATKIFTRSNSLVFTGDSLKSFLDDYNNQSKLYNYEELIQSLFVSAKLTETLLHSITKLF